MKRLLKTIENSERNNPLLTEALKEIDRLQSKIKEASNVLDSTMDKMRINDGPWYTPSREEVIEAKIDLISNILDPAY